MRCDVLGREPDLSRPSIPLSIIPFPSSPTSPSQNPEVPITPALPGQRAGLQLQKDLQPSLQNGGIHPHAGPLLLTKVLLVNGFPESPLCRLSQKTHHRRPTESRRTPCGRSPQCPFPESARCNPALTMAQRVQGSPMHKPAPALKGTCQIGETHTDKTLEHYEMTQHVSGESLRHGEEVGGREGALQVRRTAKIRVWSQEGPSWGKDQSSPVGTEIT